MNPITVFKDVARRVAVEDHLAQVKEQAHSDAARVAQTVAAQVLQSRQFEQQQLDAGADAEDRYAVAELQQGEQNRRAQWQIDAQDARAKAAAYASGTNTHFDNAAALPDLESANTYLDTVGRTDLKSALAAKFAARKREQTKAAFVSALKGAKTGAEVAALVSHPEYKDLINDPEVAPIFEVTRAGAKVADQRYGAVEARRRRAEDRAQALAGLRESGGKTPKLSPDQERVFQNDLTKAKMSLRYAADDEERALIQEQIDGLTAILERSKAKKAGGGLDPALHDELMGLLKP